MTRRNEYHFKKKWREYIKTEAKEELHLSIDLKKSNILDLVFYDKKFESLHAVEIKSAEDNFKRLENQLRTYMSLFLYVSVFIDYKHLERFNCEFSCYDFDCVGVYILNENDEVVCIREPFENYYDLNALHLHNCLNRDNKIYIPRIIDVRAKYLMRDHLVELNQTVVILKLTEENLSLYEYYLRYEKQIIDKYLKEEENNE